jgi:ferredoxin
VPKITFMNEQVTVEVPAGTNLLDAAEQGGIDVFRGIWPGLHCGVAPFFARGSCNRCKLWVSPLAEGAVNPKTRKETSGLRLNGTIPASGNLRLACQVTVSGDVEVRTRAGGPERKPNPDWAPDPRPSKWKERWETAKAGGGGGEEEPEEEAAG